MNIDSQDSLVNKAPGYQIPEQVLKYETGYTDKPHIRHKGFHLLNNLANKPLPDTQIGNGARILLTKPSISVTRKDAICPIAQGFGNDE